MKHRAGEGPQQQASVQTCPLLHSISLWGPAYGGPVVPQKDPPALASLAAQHLRPIRPWTVVHSPSR